jgi:hypothetical protein
VNTIIIDNSKQEIVIGRWPGARMTVVPKL